MDAIISDFIIIFEFLRKLPSRVLSYLIYMNTIISDFSIFSEFLCKLLK